MARSIGPNVLPMSRIHRPANESRYPARQVRIGNVDLEEPWVVPEVPPDLLFERVPLARPQLNRLLRVSGVQPAHLQLQICRPVGRHEVGGAAVDPTAKIAVVEDEV